MFLIQYYLSNSVKISGIIFNIISYKLSIGP